jgi:hypothetical protein
MKLSDYYRQTVKMNESFTGGWATHYYGVFTKVIKENNYKIVAEVGIGYGTHAKYILQNNDIDKLYLIDPMKYYPNDGFAVDIMNQESDDHFNELHSLISNELSQWNNKVTWFRTESLNVTQEQIPDESLDCVFVDGDHSYNAVLEDLRFWFKKVRPGGQMLGDDYWMPDVRRAVEEFSSEIGICFDFLTKEGTDYKIFRFQK